MLNIAVLVSGGGTNLQALLDAQQSGVLHSGHITLVISNRPDAYALTRAQLAGVAAVALPKERGETAENYGERLIAELHARCKNGVKGTRPLAGRKGRSPLACPLAP